MSTDLLGRRPARVLARAAVVAAASIPLAMGALAPTATASPVGYDIEEYGSGTDVTVTIPTGVCTVEWTVIGGQGGTSSFPRPGGLAGEVSAPTAVTAGQQFVLRVGQAGSGGSGGSSGSVPSGGTSADNDGPGGGGGGGASVVLSGSTPVIVAGGGGGSNSHTAGGAGGATGAKGEDFIDGPGVFGGGHGGTTSAPGAGGENVTGTGSAGSAGSGSRGADAPYGASAGGGGYFGGGSGALESDGFGASGGGGSNLAPAGATFNGTTSTRTGSGEIVGRYVACPSTPPTTPTAPAAPSAPVAPAATGSGVVYSATPTSSTVLTGRGTPGAVVTVREGAVTVGTATVTPAGTWSLTLPALSVGRHAFAATQTVGGLTSAASSAGTVTVERLRVKIVKTVDPTRATRPLIRGVGNAGARIAVRTVGGKLLGRTTVGSDGTWRLRSTKVSTRTYKIRATQQVAGTTLRSRVVTFTARPRH